MYATYKDSREQSRVLRQLKEIFSSTPHWRLQEICRVNNWDLDSCIDQLKNIYVETPYDVKDVKNSQQQQQQFSKINMYEVKKNNFNKDEERIGALIKKGYRVMILLRGPPGVGKSYLARSLVTNFVDLENSSYNAKDFIYSSDDYFYNSRGVYKYNSAFITYAHEFNQQRVRDKMNFGLSPIFIDNTNMQLWEMLPYVKFAVENNYLIEILEPQTPWRKSLSTLAQKNKHRVPLNRIQKLMEKYEKGSVASLTRMLKNTKYTKTLPQMRSLPPLNAVPKNSQVAEYADNRSPRKEFLEEEQYRVWDCESREKEKSNRLPDKSYEQQDSTVPNFCSPLEKLPKNTWKNFESEYLDFWGKKPSKPQEQEYLPITASSENIVNGNSLLDLLRDNSGATPNDLKTLRQDSTDKTKALNTFERHSIGCPNEKSEFVSLRQIYPNKRVSGLWDLFVKCNGDVDWAVDILLKEDELERFRDDDSIYQMKDDELFECFCNNSKRETVPSLHTSKTIVNNDTKTENLEVKLNPGDAKPQRQRSRFSRFNQRTTTTSLEMKENIENCFVLGDDQYSEHLLKIRNIRSAAKNVTCPSNSVTETNRNIQSEIKDQLMANEEHEKDVKDEDDDVDVEGDSETDDINEEMLEMSLGDQLIQQLVDTFGNESSIENMSSFVPVNLKVFMPRSLAKQLYMLCMESAFNHMEEERQKLIKEDEDFARLLKNPKYSGFQESPNNIREILDMEYAWQIYTQDKDNTEKLNVPKDLASHLSQMKLCEEFPDIPRETLSDILATNGNDYNKIVTVLRSTMKMEGDMSATRKYLMERVRQEQDLVTQQVQNQTDKQQKRVSTNWDDSEQKSTSSPDEAKRLALREFEESRNLAAHHCQLKAECYRKAKEAIQCGNGGAAIYYSQIANLHIKKIDIYNNRAANCIMDVHRNAQNNPDLLDLHYLYLVEALGCLDLFLDRHITQLRAESRNYKHVFIITGRGKHSAGGVSTIKNKVKARLKERCLRWTEVNPGLLKVKIFSGSRHSKNI